MTLGMLLCFSMALASCSLLGSRGCHAPPGSTGSPPASSSGAPYAEMAFTQISPPCADCPQEFQKALSSQPGITSIKTISKNKNIVVGYDPSKAKTPKILEAAKQSQYKPDDPTAKNLSKSRSGVKKRPCTCTQSLDSPQSISIKLDDKAGGKTEAAQQTQTEDDSEAEAEDNSDEEDYS